MIEQQTSTGDLRCENRRTSVSIPYHSPFALACLSVVMILCMTGFSVAADPPRKSGELVNKGNRLLSEGYFGQALAAYDQALEKSPSSAEIAYDRGIALYRLGRFAEAETAFQDALATRQPALEAKAKYNLGRCAHSAAMAEQQDMEHAINGLSRAIGFYKDAMQLRPEDADARHNSSMAERLQSYLNKKLALAKKQKPPSTSQPSDKKPSDDSQKGEDQKQDGGQQQNDQNDKDQQSGEEHSEKQDSENDEESSESDPSTQPGEEQDAASQPSSQPAMEPESEAASQPSAETATQPVSITSQPTTQPGGDPNAMRRISIEQAMRMLQEARDAEQKRREKKRLMKLRRQGRIQVDKDW